VSEILLILSGTIVVVGAIVYYISEKDSFVSKIVKQHKYVRKTLGRNKENIRIQYIDRSKSIVEFDDGSKYELICKSGKPKSIIQLNN